jgi:hypothetical protein
MKRYEGIRTPGTRRIDVLNDGGDRRTLKPVMKHSYTKFPEYPACWGCRGNGTRNAAYMILLDCLGAERAEALHTRFSVEVLERCNERYFLLPEEEILTWSADLKQAA